MGQRINPVDQVHDARIAQASELEFNRRRAEVEKMIDAGLTDEQINQRIGPPIPSEPYIPSFMQEPEPDPPFSPSTVAGKIGNFASEMVVPNQGDQIGEILTLLGLVPAVGGMVGQGVKVGRNLLRGGRQAAIRAARPTPPPAAVPDFPSNYVDTMPASFGELSPNMAGAQTFINSEAPLSIAETFGYGGLSPLRSMELNFKMGGGQDLSTAEAALRKALSAKPKVKAPKQSRVESLTKVDKK